ncbi:hypothetical protein [Hymenobacter rubidus]|uniref:hypothetical protein n=1 Tax=Hymenobacter rubidus TaxID=1441626 RepID=UPI001F34F0F0|nr:hypothetical protein [Hymenobacter rubidus]
MMVADVVVRAETLAPVGGEQLVGLLLPLVTKPTQAEEAVAPPAQLLTTDTR